MYILNINNFVWHLDKFCHPYLKLSNYAKSFPQHNRGQEQEGGLYYT